MRQKSKTREKEIPESKIKSVKELLKLMKEKKTILIASIKNLPTSQFQEISKKMRGKAVIKVLKKSLVLRALDQNGNKEMETLRASVDDSTAILFSDLDSFELAAELIEGKSPAKAKIGQEAPKDIEIEAGPTDLVPGPAISELGALGIQIQIEKGKIHIKEPKVIVKKGEKISAGAVGLMNKLDIKPFSIGFLPVSAFDVQEKKFYGSINVDKEGTLANLKTSFSKALAFAVEIGHFSGETIKFIIGKARRQEIAMENIFKNAQTSEINSGSETSQEKPSGEVK